MTSTDGVQDRPRQRFVTDYAELSQRVRDAGLLRRRPVHYAIRAGLLTVAFAGAVAAFLALGDSWWQLLLAAGLGLLLTQVAYLGHDAAGVLESWQIVVRHLNRVGTTKVDLFECPMAAQLRAPA